MKVDSNLFRDIERRLGAAAAPAAPALARSSGGGGFVQSLSDALREVNRAQLQSSEHLQQSIRGEGPPLHQVMAEAEEAGLAFQMTMQFRNKALEAYQEVMRMQF